MTVLTVTAGLFFILVFYICFFTDGFFERNPGLRKHNVYFVTFFQLADYNIQVLLADTVQQGLMILGIVYCFQSQIFLHHLGQRLRHLILITFVYGFIAFISIRNGKFCFSVKDRGIFYCQSISGCHCI